MDTFYRVSIKDISSGTLIQKAQVIKVPLQGNLDMQRNQQTREKSSFFSISTKASSSYFTPLNNPQSREKQQLNQNVQEQEHSGEKLTGLHARLQEEAEKIRRFKTQTESELRVKDLKITEAHQTIENLRKSALELQLENENLSQKLQEEIANREEITEKINSTRDMCTLLKDYGTKLDDRLQKCETERTELKYMEIEHRKEFEAITSQFQQLEISAAESIEKIKMEFDVERNKSNESKNGYEEKLLLNEEKLIQLMMESQEKETKIIEIHNLLELNSQKGERLEAEYENIIVIMKEKNEDLSRHKEKLEQMSSELTTYKDVKENLEKDIDVINFNLQDALNNKDKMCNNFSDTEKLYLSKIKHLQDELVAATNNLEQNNNKIAELDISLTKSHSTIEDLKCAKDMLMLERTNALETIKHLENIKLTANNELRELDCQMTDLKNKNTTAHDELKELKERLNQNQIRIEEANKEISDMTTLIITKDKRIFNLGEEIESKQEAFVQLQCQLDEKCERERSLSIQIDEMKSQWENESSEYKAVLEKNAQLNCDKKLIQNNLTSANKELKKVQKELEKTQSKQNGVTYKAENLTKELEDVRGCLSELEAKVKEDNDRMNKALQEKEYEIGKLKKIIEEKLDLLVKEETKRKELKADIVTKTKEAKDLEKEIKILKKDINVKNKSSSNLTDKSNDLQCELATTLEKLENIKRENEDLTKDMKSMNLEIKLEKAKVIELEENFKRSEQEKEGINSRCDDDLKRMADILDRSQTDYQKIIEKKDHEIQQISKKISTSKELEKDVKILKKDLDKSDKELVKLKKENASFKEQWNKDKDAYDKNIQQLEDDMKTKNARIYSTEEEVSKCKEQILNLQTEMQAKDREIQTSCEKTNTTLTKLEQTNTTLTKLEQLNNELTDENSSLKVLNENLKTKHAQSPVSVAKTKTAASSAPSTPKIPLTPSARKAPPFFSTIKGTPKQSSDNLINGTPLAAKNGILRIANTYSANKKRRNVVFASTGDENEENNSELSSSSSSEMMEIELRDIETDFKNKSAKSAPVLFKPSPRMRGPEQSPRTFNTPLQPVPRGQPVSAKKPKTDVDRTEIDKFKSLFPAYKTNVENSATKKPSKCNPNVKKTPSRSSGKYFKSSPAERKKTFKNKPQKNVTADELAWFDSDAVFGFGPED